MPVVHRNGQTGEQMGTESLPVTQIPVANGLGPRQGGFG